MENSNRIISILLIFLVMIAILMQVKLYTTFLKNKDALENDPLAFGARKYGIEFCGCQISETTSIIFDKNGSKTVITKRGSNIPLNFTWDK